MFDAVSAMMQEQPPERLAQMASPTAQNPGGGPQPPLDPLQEGFDACIVALKRFAQDAKLNGAEDVENEAEQMALRLSKHKMRRKDQFNKAFSDMQGSVLSAQM